MSIDALTNPKRYICIIPNAWGKGHTPDEAFKTAKREGSRGRQAWKVIYEYDSADDRRVFMDSMGYLSYPASAFKIVDTRKANS